MPEQTDRLATVVDLAPRRARSYAAAAQNQAAYRDWEAGLISPYLITTALDMCALHGPAVDEACGVEEPTVDQWESGLVYPTWEQLCALAALTGFAPAFFSRRGRDLKAVPQKTSILFHRTGGCGWQQHGGAPLVPAFLPEAITKTIRLQRRSR